MARLLLRLLHESADAAREAAADVLELSPVAELLVPRQLKARGPRAILSNCGQCSGVLCAPHPNQLVPQIPAVGHADDLRKVRFMRCERVQMRQRIGRERTHHVDGQQVEPSMQHRTPQMGSVELGAPTDEVVCIVAPPTPRCERHLGAWQSKHLPLHVLGQPQLRRWLHHHALEAHVKRRARERAQAIHF